MTGIWIYSQARIPRNVPQVVFVLALSIVAAGIAAGCAETQRQRAKRIEPMLSAAGFHIHPADTPQRQQELTSMTPLKVRYDARNGKLHYWFADPTVCQCIYVGNEQSYQKYEQIRLQQQTAQREEAAAMMNEDAAQQEQMNFMMWPGDPFFY
jgi:hypothetical protein